MLYKTHEFSQLYTKSVINSEIINKIKNRTTESAQAQKKE